MSNLRIIWDNAADRAFMVASSTAGGLGVSNLRTERKGEVHRSVGTNVTFTLTWAASQVLSGVVIPACNLTSEATMRVQGWDAETDGAQLLDTGSVPACPGQTLTAADWGQPVTAAMFALGAASKAAAWFGETAGVRRLQVNLSDPANPAGFLDCARLVVGKAWTPTSGASFGATYSTDDLSDFSRSDSGGVLIDRAAVKESMTFSLDTMRGDDRADLDRLVRIVSGSRAILVSLLPDSSDRAFAHSTLIYGFFQKPSPVSIIPGFFFRRSLTVEGW